MRGRLTYIEIIAKTDMDWMEFFVSSLELASSRDSRFFADDKSIALDYNRSGVCKITAVSDTSVPPVMLRLRSIHIFIPAENKEIVVSENPENPDEFPFGNEFMVPLSVKISDGNEILLYHIHGTEGS